MSGGFLFDFARAAPPRLGNFVAADNSEVLQAVTALAIGESSEPTIYLWGESASGKTHLLQAACAAAKKNSIAHYILGCENSLPPPSPGLLAVDDAESLADEARRDLFNWFNYAKKTDSGIRLLVAGRESPSAAPFADELRTRLGGGLVFRLRPLMDAEMREAMLRHCERKNYRLPTEIADFLLLRMPRALSQLLAAVDDLDEFALSSHRPLNLKTTRDWLAEKNTDASRR